MEERYIRNLGALTEGECHTLREKKLLVAGCGGLGGHIIDMLLRVGVGAIVAADGDSFEPSNLNRQLLSELPLMGKSKARAAAERAMRVNPDVRFEAVEAYLDEKNAPALISGCDAVMDALDNVESRRTLSRACCEAGVPFVHGAINGWIAQAGVSLPGDGLMDALYPAGAELRDKSALAFTPALCAAMQVSLAVRLLCGRAVETGRVYYMDLEHMEFEAFF